MHEISNDIIVQIITTLKDLDVRGFDSMNKLVGLVGYFENLYNSPTVDARNEVK